MRKLTLGSDPEFIVSKDGNIVPYLVEDVIDLEGFVKIHRDNILLEINTTLATSKKEFRSIHEDSLKLVGEFIKKEFGMEITKLSSYDFKGLDDPRFWEYGCAPTENIYNDFHVTEHPYETTRFCGGHVHIGLPNKSVDYFKNIIRNLDYNVGLNLEEQQNDRRKFYGMAGDLRVLENIKVEYRTPSNDWVFGGCDKLYDGIIQSIEDTENNVGHEFDHQLINQVKQLVEC